MLPNPSFPMEAIAQLSEVLALRRANVNAIMNHDFKMGKIAFSHFDNTYTFNFLSLYRNRDSVFITHFLHSPQ